MYRSTKRFPHLLSIAFRQWRALESQCQFVHGYGISVTLTFESSTLDTRNWVVDFGGMRVFKQSLEDALDHKLVVAHDDPLLPHFEALDAAGGCQLVIIDEVSCECFAEYIYQKLITDFVLPNGVYITEVRVDEHEANSASYIPSAYDRERRREDAAEILGHDDEGVDQRFHRLVRRPPGAEESASQDAAATAPQRRRQLPRHPGWYPSLPPDNGDDRPAS
jgi:6-pyruvoyl-tetrahydropterin synthase